MNSVNVNSIPGLLTLSVRIIILTLGVMIGVMVMFAGVKNSWAASLRSVSVIDGDTLTAGDLFDGLSADKSAYVLGPAPRPGQDMVLNARTLLRVASALDLPWQPVSTADQVTIRRAATIIGTEDIRKGVAVALEDEGLEGRYVLTFAGADPQIILPQGELDTFDVTELRFDSLKDAFEARLQAPSKDNPVSEVTVTGRIQRLVPVPVLKSVLRSGDIIGARDIAWIDLPSRDIQHDIVLSEDGLVGMTPRRLAEAGKPLRDIELQRPVIINRGADITLVYESGAMVLSTKGKSLQSGAKGDLVRVVNINSNKSLNAVVTAENEARVIE